MSDKYFFDTNILVYMQDASAPDKQSKARALFKTCTGNGTAVISTQCLQEFYNIIANKLKQDKFVAKGIIRDFYSYLPVVTITPVLIEYAIDVSIQSKLSFWDSLIVSAAISSDCDILYSEDLNNGQIINGIKVVNPFI